MDDQRQNFNNLFAEVEIKELADATVVKRIAGRYADRLNFSANRQAETVLVASELAHNHLQHHTVDGKIRISVMDIDTRPCLTIASLDNGPGIANIEQAVHGKSTGNGLGAGLGTVARFSNRLEICSFAHGEPLAPCVEESHYATVIVASLYGRKTGIASAKPGPADLDVSVLNKALIKGCSGDGAFVDYDGHYVRLVLVDGAGHGKEAAAITHKAGKELGKLGLYWPPEHIIAELEKTLAQTRGLAIHVLLFDCMNSTLQSAGIGNIQVRLYLDGVCIVPRLNHGVVGRLKWQRAQRRNFGPCENILAFLHTDGQQPLPSVDLTSFFELKGRGIFLNQFQPSDFRLSASLWAQILFEPGQLQPDDTTLAVFQWS